MKSLVKVIIRIFSLFFCYKLLLTVNSLINYIGSDLGVGNSYKGPGYHYYISFIILYTVLGITLWLYNDRMAEIIVGNEDTVKCLQINITYEQFMSITMIIFGIVLIINSIEPAIMEITNAVSINLNVLYSPNSSYYLISILNPVIKILVGFFLIYKNKRGVSD